MLDQLGNLWAQLVGILDRLYSGTRVPALGNLENAVAGFEHAAGETIKTEFFGTGSEVGFRSRVVERDVIVLDRGSAVFAG